MQFLDVKMVVSIGTTNI